MGMVKIHNIEILIIRLKANHWAKLMGIEIVNVVTKKPDIVIKEGKKRIKLPIAENPRIFTRSQVRNCFLKLGILVGMVRLHNNLTCDSLFTSVFEVIFIFRE